MSLITRCPSCGTLFKVVPDQLRISDGWVRCGHCAEIFDAYAQMQKTLPEDSRQSAPETVFGEPDPDEHRGPLRLPTRPSPPPPPVAPPPPPPAPAAREATPPSRPPPESTRAQLDDEALDIQLDELLRVEVTPDAAPAASAVESSPIDVPPADSGRERERDRARRRRRRESSSAPPDSETGESAADLAFVRAARRRSRWRRPWVRALLGLLALTLATLLAAQVAVQERDRLAALEPRLRPVLEALCEPLACRIQPPRLLDTVAIDGVVFTRLLPDVFQFAFTLRSSAPHEVAMPAIELTLTDRQEQVLVRRVVRPAEMRAPAALAARGEWSGSVRLALDPAAAPERVTGYRVLTFHP